MADGLSAFLSLTLAKGQFGLVILACLACFLVSRFPSCLTFFSLFSIFFCSKYFFFAPVSPS